MREPLGSLGDAPDLAEVPREERDDLVRFAVGPGSQHDGRARPYRRQLNPPDMNGPFPFTQDQSPPISRHIYTKTWSRESQGARHAPKELAPVLLILPISLLLHSRSCHACTRFTERGRREKFHARAPLALRDGPRSVKIGVMKPMTAIGSTPDVLRFPSGEAPATVERAWGNERRHRDKSRWSSC